MSTSARASANERQPRIALRQEEMLPRCPFPVLQRLAQLHRGGGEAAPSGKASRQPQRAPRATRESNTTSAGAPAPPPWAATSTDSRRSRKMPSGAPGKFCAAKPIPPAGSTSSSISPTHSSSTMKEKREPCATTRTAVRVARRRGPARAGGVHSTRCMGWLLKRRSTRIIAAGGDEEGIEVLVVDVAEERRRAPNARSRGPAPPPPRGRNR